MTDDRLERLERLAKLRDDGVLDAAEFEAEKARILKAGEQPQAEARTVASPTASGGPRKRIGWLTFSLIVLAVLVAGIIVMVALSRRPDTRPTAAEPSLPVAAAPEAPNSEPVSGSPLPDAPAPEPLETAVAQDAIAPPNIIGDWRHYRTRIREGWTTAPTLAGRYVVIRFGCGMGCTVGIVGDHRSGDLYDLGLGGEEQMYLNLDFDDASNRVQARWEDLSADACVSQVFQWSGSTMKPVSAKQSTPRSDEPCDVSY